MYLRLQLEGDLHETLEFIPLAVRRKLDLAGLKLSLAAPAVDGRANRACIEFLANLLKVPRSSVTIASGQTSRRKVIRVAGLAAEGVRKALFASQ